MVSSWLWRPHLLDLRRSAITSSERSASRGNRFLMIKLYIRRCTVTGAKVFLTLTVRRIGYRLWTRRMRSVLDGMIVNVLREIKTRGVPVPWRMTQIVSKRTTCPSLAWRSRCCDVPGTHEAESELSCLGVSRDVRLGVALEEFPVVLVGPPFISSGIFILSLICAAQRFTAETVGRP